MPPRLAVEQTGSGPPVVLLHGIAADSRIWGPAVPGLARARTVLTVDLPGFGRSQPAGEGFELTAVAGAILDGLATHGLDGPFDLVGHSLGGGVAIQLAHIAQLRRRAAPADQPAALRRLILVAPAGLRPFPPLLTALLASERASALLSSGADAFLAARRRAAPLADLAWGRRLLLGLSVADPGQVSPEAARSLLDGSGGSRVTGPAVATLAGTDLRPLLSQITARIGAVWGEEDQTVPIRGLADLLAARPDTEVIRLPGTGHVPMVERPEAFLEALERLLGPATSARPS